MFSVVRKIMNVLCWLLIRRRLEDYLFTHKIVVNTKVHHMFTSCNSDKLIILTMCVNLWVW